MADTLYVNDSGLQDALDNWDGAAIASLLAAGVVHLFNGSALASQTVSLATLAAQESSFPGYATASVAGLAFPSSSIVAHVATALAANPASFTCSGGGSAQSVYGAYITDAGSTKLLACWNFTGGPFVMLNNTDNITTTPTLTAQSLN